jgi:hypothetical protein
MDYMAYGRLAAMAKKRHITTPPRARKAWDRIRDLVSAEHRVIEHRSPDSPRVRPTLGTVGFIMIGGAK